MDMVAIEVAVWAILVMVGIGIAIAIGIMVMVEVGMVVMVEAVEERSRSQSRIAIAVDILGKASMKANILLEGDIATGKTTSLRTLLPTYIDERGTKHKGAGLDTYIISLDPGLQASLGPNLCSVKDDGRDDDNSKGAHWHYLRPPLLSPDVSMKWAIAANEAPTLERLKNVPDPTKRNYTQFLSLYRLLHNFQCQGCNANFGSVYQMDERHAFVLDGLTGIGEAAQRNYVGSRPPVEWLEYRWIQNGIYNLINEFWKCTSCSAIVIAHLERENDPDQGVSYVTMRAIGQKLAKLLEMIPDDIIVTHQREGKFTWDTSERGMHLKSRHLPSTNNLPPDFTQIFARR